MTGQTATMGPMERLGHAVSDWRSKLRERGIDLATMPPIPDSHRETPEDRAERLRLQRANRDARWAQRLPVMYEHATLADLDGDATRAATWLDGNGSTLVLAGVVGTGKTHTAYAVGNTAVHRGLWCEAWTVSDLLEVLRPGTTDAARELAQHAVRTCDLLILDDVTTGKVSEWAVEQFTSLLDHRLRNLRRQIVTTNAGHDALLEAWGARALDRLRYRWTVVALTGASRRVAAW